MHVETYQQHHYNQMPQPVQSPPMAFVQQQQPQHVPAPAPAPGTKICRNWARDGRCPTKNCPFSSSHTAENSPRYAKFRDPALQQQVVEAVSQPMRAHALIIKDVSPPRTPPKESAETKPVEAPRTAPRPNALEIVDSPVRKDKQQRKERNTPSPPGSRLGRWMNNEASS